MIVKIRAYGRFSSVGGGGHPWEDLARAVKYMANNPAKNINSLESQMMVPTLTMFGRVRECTREVSKVLLATGAVVTSSSWHRNRLLTTWGGCAGRCGYSGWTTRCDGPVCGASCATRLARVSVV